MMSLRFVTCSPAVIAAALVASACAQAPTAPSHQMLHADVSATAAAVPSAAGLLKAVHAETSRYHSTTQATKAGYEVVSPCVKHPTLGAMDFHWANGALIDPVFDALQPEAVLYEPGPNGSLKLVAVEYIAIKAGQPAPVFDGQPFDDGGTPVPVDHWSLHVWVHKDNPNGTFAPFNPSVTCP